MALLIGALIFAAGIAAGMGIADWYADRADRRQTKPDVTAAAEKEYTNPASGLYEGRRRR